MKNKNKVFCLLFMIFLVSFMILSIVTPDKDISTSERRKLTQKPQITLKTVFNGKYFENIDKYLVDQFPFRDNFRKFKGIISNKIFSNNFDNSVFVENGNIFELEFNLDEKSVNYIMSLINKVIDNDVKSDSIYYAIVPDKNYYLKKKNIPSLDYKKMEEILNDGLNNAQYISLFNSLQLNSYYSTDIHWKQEELGSVVDEIGKNMGFLSTMPQNKKEFNNFYGSLYSKISTNVKPDKITYLYNDVISSAKVYDYEKQKYISVYNDQNFSTIDPYNVYLGGAKPLLIIENEKCNTEKELVLFRDSFGSSIAPLLIENYRKITMIDLRYISSSLLDIVDFNENQDILFLYSTTVINNSFTLR